MPIWFRRLRARIKYRHFDRDLRDEIETHRLMAREAFEAGGDNSAETRRRAAVEFGNALLARESARSVWIPLTVQRWRTDAHWAWRGLRARRWRAPLIILLLAFALAANTLLFAAADSLLFRPVNHADPDRLVTLMIDQGGQRGPAPLMLNPPGILDDLRSRRDAFAGLHGYMTGGYTFVMDPATPKQEPTTFVTPGLVEMLGWQPKAGRSLADADMARTDQRAILVADSLATERFGSARLAIGRVLETSEDPLVIVGVMPKAFQFPDNRARVWRPLDYRAVKDGALRAIGKLAPGMTPDRVGTALAGFSAGIPDSRGMPAGRRISAEPLVPVLTGSRTLLWTLIGAGTCLLLIVCANIASLEVAGAMARSRASSIQVAMGATTSNLVRTRVLEGAAVVGVAMALAWWSCWLLQGVVAAWIPPRMIRFATNPIDLDLRASLFMAALAAFGWLTVSLPVALHASRRTVTRALNELSRNISVPPNGARIRHALTVIEVALGVVLVIGAVLYTRTYAALIAIDKGFDSSSIVGIDLTLPTARYSAPGATTALLDRITAKLRSRSDVEAFARLRSSVFDLNSTITTLPAVDDQPPSATPLALSLRTVDRSFFDTLQLTPVRGRLFETGEDPTNVVITPALANRLWPGTDPIGHHLHTDPQQPWLTVVGVVPHIRYASQIPGDRYGQFYQLYVPPAPPAPRLGSQALTHVVEAAPVPRVPALPANVPRSGALFMFLNFAARLDRHASLDDLTRDLRSIDSGFAMEIEPVDATYAAVHQDRLLAARTIGAFGTLSFLVAIAGIYGVMAFLVAGRGREMGIRLTLGATDRQIRHLVLGSAVRLALIGGFIGVAAALLLTRWLGSQFYGVAPVAPWTYAMVAMAFILAAIGATWLPARTASQSNPAEILRQE